MAAENKDNVNDGDTFKVTSDEIVEFWFGKLASENAKIDGNKMKKWFMGGKEFDDEIKNKYGAFMKFILNEKGKEMQNEWQKTPKGCLALIILNDQFPRNVYRNTAKMFANDSNALNLCLFAIEKKYDEELIKMHPTYNMFLWMPLMHSEEYKYHEIMQQKSSWILSVLDKNHACYKLFSDDKYRKEHADIIKQFGRYPQRNHILGRVTTEKEKIIMTKHNLMSLIDHSKGDKNKKNEKNDQKNDK